MQLVFITEIKFHLQLSEYDSSLFIYLQCANQDIIINLGELANKIGLRKIFGIFLSYKLLIANKTSKNYIAQSLNCSIN